MGIELPGPLESQWLKQVVIKESTGFPAGPRPLIQRHGPRRDLVLFMKYGDSKELRALTPSLSLSSQLLLLSAPSSSPRKPEDVSWGPGASMVFRSHLFTFALASPCVLFLF